MVLSGGKKEVCGKRYTSLVLSTNYAALNVEMCLKRESVNSVLTEKEKMNKRERMGGGVGRKKEGEYTKEKE